MDILAISCDSFDEEVNRKIGRHHHKERQLDILRRVRDWCTEYHVAFKINTVVNSYNEDEDMSEEITDLKPIRWKVGLKVVSHKRYYIKVYNYCTIFVLLGISVSLNWR